MVILQQHLIQLTDKIKELTTSNNNYAQIVASAEREKEKYMAYLNTSKSASNDLEEERCRLEGENKLLEAKIHKLMRMNPNAFTGGELGSSKSDNTDIEIGLGDVSGSELHSDVDWDNKKDSSGVPSAVVVMWSSLRYLCVKQLPY